MQSIATILTNAPPVKHECKATLIVAPVSLMYFLSYKRYQWAQELNDKVKAEHQLRVHVYHGSSRARSAEELNKFDVVLTSYGTLGSEINLGGKAKTGKRKERYERFLLVHTAVILIVKNS